MSGRLLSITVAATVATLGLAIHIAAASGPFGLTELSEKSAKCIDCHRRQSPALYETWGDSRHFRANIGCYECHAADRSDADALHHYGEYISIIVSPADCARCHAHEVEQFNASRHSTAGRIQGSPELLLAEVVGGNRGLETSGFPRGNSATTVTGCWQCHGSPVRVLPKGTLDPATWPNTGIGRINPDGSVGSCTACHARHAFSAAQARHPNTCGRCHLGPDHPQREIYEQSKHGTLFAANEQRMNLGAVKWVVGEDYSAAPTCATCHMSATSTMPVTHNVGQRISWNNRPAVSVRPEIADAAAGLPGAHIPWQQRRQNMTNVCLSCHDPNWVDGFYVQYDSLVELYNSKFGEPGQRLYDLARPLLQPSQFSNRLDFIWFDLWHREGRRARHGAAMMGPAYAYSSGMYEVARRFYSEFVPELRRLAAEARVSDDPRQVPAGEALQAALDEVLASDDHKWFLGRMDPDEAARRRRATKDSAPRNDK